MRWTTENNLIGISAIDTRFLTKLMRDKGLQNVCIAHNEHGEFDFDAIIQDLNSWNGVNGVDLAKDVTCTLPYEWDEKQWCAKNGFQREKEYKFHVVVIDYGVKRNILRSLVSHGCKVTVVTASSNIDEILNYNPDGVLLSNGPGDPAATGVYAVPVIKQLIAKKIPIFGICLGHQLLALAVGAKTEKMKFGHHGANHPVKNVQTNKVEITSMNHGFSVNRGSLPTDAIETHTSLFDGSNCGIALKGKPIFSVQFHPEANPGPQDSDYLFAQFVENMRRNSGTSAAA
jgi:carbamoyl-phosphate synthase small subunit